MIKTVVRFFKWTPKAIDRLYCDAYDFKGLLFWYEDALDQNKELEKKTPKL